MIEQTLAKLLYGRPLREQAMLAVGGLAVAAMLVWVAVVAPINGMRDDAVKTLARTQATFAEVDQLAAQLEATRGAASQQQSRGKTTMTELIDNSLRKHGLSIRGIQPGQQGEMFVRLEAAPTQSVWRWLYEMEAVAGATINELTINPTDKEGWVLLTARLEQAP
ncbi:type II secretion system protein M [Simiduia sp. 21SJ11W-1]|uniref:type II secretion system protein M n=1 Tax=Simiduia sp. 21SJ11W-1 TaxID=2909669 RepID=UPI00209DC422|nr:type II secretion system protein M [Simiduia sp. 21SJ11W-1]UTA47877.1 type II secretion system protein M [Simiduia sp. 21SJ11W-1]